MADTIQHPAPIVFVVDDDSSVRDSLELLIGACGWQPIVFETAEQFLSSAQPATPNCLILDVNLPDLDGFEVQRHVSDRTDLPIIFLTGYGDVPMTVRAMKGGAAEFLTKPYEVDVLLEAIRQALDRSRQSQASDVFLQGLRGRYASLSPREQQVMALVVSGLLNKQVGFELGISEITVKAHRGQVMRKMQARTLPELVIMAAKLDGALH
ncbi:response regulator transcription factor [Rhizobium calliandrae]|nr:response regulator [Rhizobium calliandrae]